MAEYHVSCGITGIYAGTIKKSGVEWQNKSLVTDEAIEAVRDYLMPDAEKSKDGQNGYEWTKKNGDKVQLIVKIKRQEAVDCLWANCDEVGSAIVPDVEAIPAADVRPVVYGKWLSVWWSGERAFGQCSNCHNTGELRTVRNEYGIWSVNMNFCPDCGADMRQRRVEE